MCGIVAWADTEHQCDQAILKEQCHALLLRGPDDEGVWIERDGHIALGNQRLAIQDLSYLGHMPMCDQSGRVWITFNGEIYNFQSLRKELRQRGWTFKSRADTEVVLVAFLEWGVQSVSHFNGMFAFAVYDGRPDTSTSRCLFLARDPFGEKPLYYWHHATGIVVASELKAILAEPRAPRRLDLRSLNSFLALGYVPSDRSILDGIHKLRPGSAALYNSRTNEFREWKCWSIPEVEKRSKESSDELVKEVRRRLLESTRARLVADVPVGILLSGGIDSSLVAAAAVSVSSRRIKTFTLRFPGGGLFDEGPHARRVAEWLGTDHHEFVMEDRLSDVMCEVMQACDEPISDSSLLPTYVLARQTRAHVKVALGGDGGDEIFGGYPTYEWVLRNLPFWRATPASIRRRISAWSERFVPIGVRGRRQLGSLGGDAGENFISRTLLFDCTARQRLLSREAWGALVGRETEPEDYRMDLWRGTGAADVVDRMTRLDFLTYLPDDILAKVDRTSMAVSLEVRSPFLDRELVEFCFSRVTSNLKVEVGARKILLRMIGAKLLPPGIDLNRKQGFSLPPPVWKDPSWVALCLELLEDVDSTIFDRAAVRRLARRSRRGDISFGYLFPLIACELWRKHYRIGCG